MKSCPVKKSIFVLLLGFFFLLTCGAGFSQDRGKEERPEPPSAVQIVSRMKQDLNLTEEQVRQVTPVIRNEIARTRGIMTQTKDREQIRALQKDTEAKLSQYLTEEQMARWRNRKQNRFQEKKSAMGSEEDEEESGQTGTKSGKKRTGGKRGN